MGKKVKEIGEEACEYYDGRKPMRSKIRKGVVIKRSYTTGSFIKDHPTGSYFILVRRHSFAIIDGVIVGNYNDGRAMKKIIERAFKIG